MGNYKQFQDIRHKARYDYPTSSVEWLRQRTEMENRIRRIAGRAPTEPRAKGHQEIRLTGNGHRP